MECPVFSCKSPHVKKTKKPQKKTKQTNQITPVSIRTHGVRLVKSISKCTMNKWSPSNRIVYEVSTWRMTSCTGCGWSLITTLNPVSTVSFHSQGLDKMIGFLFKFHEHLTADHWASLVERPHLQVCSWTGLGRSDSKEQSGISFYSIMKEDRNLPKKG